MFISITGSETSAIFRIDHSAFRSRCLGGPTTSVSILIDVSGAYGVIDHNQFTTGVELIHVQGTGDGSTAWAAPDNAGTDRAVYIEDNDFSSDCIWNMGGTNYIDSVSVVQGYRGGRYVVRHNSITFMIIDAHGWASGLSRRGTRWYEIYDNSITTPANANAYAFMQMRGGTGVIYGNDLVCGVNSDCGGIQLTDESYMVGPGCTSYPCQDQIGRGQNMGGSPLYAWDNQGLEVSIGNGADSLIKMNRDYFLSQKPGYTPYTYPHPLVSGQTPNQVCIDKDGDGYGSPASSSCTHAELDCNDASSDVHPGGTDICGNGIDEDCDGSDASCSSDIIIDNTDPGFSKAGTWSASEYAGFYKTDSLYAMVNTGSTATWTFTLPQAGTYAVYAWWTSSPGRVIDATYNVNGAPVTVNQKANGSTWNLLGNFAFSQGQAAVKLSDVSSDPSYSATISNSVSADAIKLVFSGQACAASDTDCDGCIGQDELLQHIQKWKSGVVSLANLMEAIRLWKQGC
jgi:hypothetical protein